MAHLLRAYNAALLRKPMMVQCLTAAAMFGVGDVIAQQAIEGRGKKHDFMRTARLTFYGGAMFGPIMTKWYSFLNRLKFPSPTKALIYRVYLDQAVLTPAGVVFFYASMSTLEGQPAAAWPRLQEAYVPTLLRNWAVFVPTQIVNFTLIPPHLRMVTIGVVSLFWNTYLSVMNQDLRKAQAAALEAQTAALLGAEEGKIEEFLTHTAPADPKA
ncbi:hypothetical protein D9611_012197 [Ephemerocybe angulata]|uniref:Uncharacterized protein n=1 Tax=Ephemerocybe angulata TaxID=980116 RepID=A0A8H5C6H5_9AGAR|nr:hypothetical protein D9611_012197 [Tulosesus angulatus]